MGVIAFHNGKPTSSVSIRDRGLAYGDGLFETLRVVAGKPEFFKQHLLRLQQGCERLSIPLNSLCLEREINHLLERAASPLQVLKIIVTRGGQQRGYKYDKAAEENRYLLLETLSEQGAQALQDGVKLTVCRHRLTDNPELAGIKHLNRLENVLARAEWSRSDIGEGLMLDSVGRIIEGTMSNVFLVKDGELLTPALQRCGVAGIMRQVVIEQLAPALKLTVKIREIDFHDLQAADEAFICNSLLGICPVTAVDCLTVNSGPVTRTLQKTLEDMR